MGEIKSTLDIVMEKTKHLSLSKAEKDAQKIEEIRKTGLPRNEALKSVALQRGITRKQAYRMILDEE